MKAKPVRVPGALRALVPVAFLALVAFLPPASAASSANASGAVRARVLDYCKANLGRRVGNGQCSALAARALKAAGAKPRAQRGFPTDRDYVWGHLVLVLEATPDGPRTKGSMDEVRPGDIAQFSNARFAAAHFAHHTAVVASIDARHLGLFEQNVGGKQVVLEGSVRIDRMSAGWVRFYRPIPAVR